MTSVTSRRPGPRFLSPAPAALALLLAASTAACTGTADETEPEEIPHVTQPTETQSQPTPSSDPDEGTDEGTDEGGLGSGGPPRVDRTVADGLAVPWGMDFLPNGDAVVTERDRRRVLRVSPDGEVTELGTVEQAQPAGEAGLLGLAVSPDFAQDRSLFVYVTTAEDNRVLRLRLEPGGLSGPEVVLDGIPQGFIHDGGRLAFGPDGHLYVSTGEVGSPDLAQDPDSLGGKILRITPEGDPAPGNPRPDSPVWSSGHRNVQGMAWDDRGRMWASEFGDSTWDELNLIEAGANYGWPVVEGVGDDDRFRDPQLVWPVEEASPSGLAFADGHLWLAGLRGERLWRIPVDRQGASDPRAFFAGEHGRLRTVASAPDGSLWLTTSNQDGRGTPAPGDDRILRVS